ncbi:hypothetical protein EV421DRAFT_1913016 [Armillaria borealis]|uniref:Uncharacterized protein n=1 Tax=Armillaria borealis TaxID=47425 RepID=A0AA39MD14_9AGAR|nr:hypothetical protein EV421DRAFT_1913016 [Armillaria borealis]
MKRSADQDPDSENGYKRLRCHSPAPPWSPASRHERRTQAISAWREATSTRAAEVAAGSHSPQLAKAPFIPMIVTIDDMDIDPPSNRHVVDDCSMSGESTTEEQDKLDSQHSTDLTPTPAAIDVNGSAWERAQEQPVVGKGGTTLVGLTSRTGSDNAMRPLPSMAMDTDLSTMQDGSAENSIANTVDNARDNGAAINDAMGDRLAVLAASGSGAFMASPGHEIADILESEIVVGRGSEMRGIGGYECAAGSELEGEEDDGIQGNTGDSAVVPDDPTRKQCTTPLDERMGGTPAMSPSGSLDIAATLQRDHMEDMESEIIERSGGKTHANGSEWAGFPELGHERVAGKSPYNVSASSMPDTGKELYKNQPSQILLALQQDNADIAPSEADVDNCEEITDGDVLKQLRGPSERAMSRTLVSVQSGGADSAPSEVDVDNGYEIDADNGSEIDVDNGYEIADEHLSEVTGDAEPGMPSEKSMSQMSMSVRSDDADSAPSEVNMDNGYEIDVDNGYEINMDSGYEIVADDLSDATADGDLCMPSEKPISQMSMSVRSDDADSAPSEVDMDNGYEVADGALSDVTGDGGHRTSSERSIRSILAASQPHFIREDTMLMLAIPGLSIQNFPFSHVPPRSITLSVGDAAPIQRPVFNETPPYIPSGQVDAMEPATYPGDTSNRWSLSLSDIDFMDLSTRRQVNDGNTTMPPASALFSHHGVSFLSHLGSVSEASSSHCASGHEFDDDDGSEIDEDDGSEVNDESGDSEMSECSCFLEGLSDESRINLSPRALSILHEVDDEDFTGVYAAKEESLPSSAYTPFEELGDEGSEIDMSNCTEADEISSKQSLDLDDFTDFLMERRSSFPSQASAVLSHKIYGESGSEVDDKSGSEVDDKSGSKINDKSGSEIFELCDDVLFARDTNPGESNSGYPSSPTNGSHQVPSMHRRPPSRPQKTYQANCDRFHHSTHAGAPQEDVEDFASAINAVSSDEDADTDQEHRTAWEATDSSSLMEGGEVPAQSSNHSQNTNPPPNNMSFRKTLPVCMLISRLTAGPKDTRPLW